MRIPERARRIADRLTGSLWFLPGVIVLVFMAAAVLLIEVSIVLDPWATQRLPRVFEATAESARNMLSSIASSVITVAGVTFSIMVVAVSQASSQYTPRILRNFMRDRMSQITLGVLVGVFVYCLVVLRTVIDDDDVNFVPVIAVTASLVFVFIAVALLVYFIHHIASTLEAGSIINSVSEDTLDAIDRLFPEQLGAGPEDTAVHQDTVSKDEAEYSWQPLTARSSGYVQHVDSDGLLALAREHDGVIKMAIGIGEFATAGRPLAFVSKKVDAEEFEAKLMQHYVIASFRTVQQDAAFGIRQIVDIGLKALSPSVNDVTTAVTCVQYLGAILVRLAPRSIPSEMRFLEGQLRVIAPGPGFAELLALAFDEMRRAAAGSVRMLENLVCALENIERVTPQSRKEVLKAQVRKLQAAMCSDPAVQSECGFALASCARMLGSKVSFEAGSGGTESTCGASAQ